MPKLEELLQPHSIEAVCAADRTAGKSYILIDLGRDSKGHAVPSLERLKRKVNKCIANDKKLVFAVTKLYIVGHWNAVELGEEQNEVSWTCSSRAKGFCAEVYYSERRHLLKRKNGKMALTQSAC